MTTEALTVAPSKFEVEQIFNDEDFRDAIGGVWVTGRNGNRWRVVLSFGKRTGASRRALWAHIAEARGRQNRIRVPMSLLSYIRAGSGGGSPLLVGAHAAGATSLSIDGGSGTTDWLKGGDWIAVENELKLVTGDVDLTAGAGTIKIWPELHQARANNFAVDVSTPHGDFFLVDAQGMGGVPFPNDWMNDRVVVVLEEDVYA